MAKISEELRKWCDDLDSTDTVYTSNLYHLADRIDAEMVELPKDKGGEPINLGDEVCLNGKNGHVTRIDYRIDNERHVIFWSGSECIVCMETELAELTHERPDSLERPDSWERIAYDFETCVFIDNEDKNRFRHELAQRIRRLAKEGGHE